MNCPTCTYNEMTEVGYYTDALDYRHPRLWCPRCGTIAEGKTVLPPLIIKRINATVRVVDAMASYLGPTGGRVYLAKEDHHG